MRSPATTSLRERKKAEAYATVLSTAHRLFRRDSFDATTLQAICDASSISKRTFFRYFRDKESLVFPHREERLAAFVAVLDENQDMENPFDTLRLAAHLFGANYNKNKVRLREQQAVILASPALLAREREIDREWQRAIATCLSRRSGRVPEDDHWARVSAGAIMGTVRATMTYWFDRDCRDDLAQLGVDALNYLERGFRRRSHQ